MKEIIFYGRGGQGVVTASKWFVLAALFEDKYAHAIPSFGQERKGAPVFTHARIDKDPVSTKSFVYQPDCAVVFDHHLPDIGVDYSQGIKGRKNPCSEYTGRRHKRTWKFFSFCWLC